MTRHTIPKGVHCYECKHLNHTKREQDKSGDKEKSHFCLRQQTRVYHRRSHPDIEKCQECIYDEATTGQQALINRGFEQDGGQAKDIWHREYVTLTYAGQRVEVTSTYGNLYSEDLEAIMLRLEELKTDLRNAGTLF